ncbi:MAG: hypothetical protein HN742_01355 [Lentisphaerae bacterium]|jgi:hypothetical protein|nr:hypothetical protein [Lentisphaerota bacterium]MBT4819532.1 hypothetical protein [Lentisphaerota bacterium]MBT5612545.1 hypothetical protein [Lentisphaerota bacterium]MBT7061340.1 hypothetical protein [Lentisphaerota bacterium]MBT7840481.1 hypothetical protein [Lentisphaerota bacterium]
MLRVLVLGCAFVLAVTRSGLCAAPIVTNSDFSATTVAGGNLPVAWSVPAGSPWTGTNADGHSGQFSLQCRARRGTMTAPVTQTVTLPADTTLVLTCALKTDGKLKPVVRIRGGAETGVELARIVSAGVPGRWQRYAVAFNTGAGGATTVELWVDVAQLHRPDRPGRAGSIAVDDVQVLTATAAQAPRDNAFAVTHENVARGKPYTLYPSPGYVHSTDAGDRTQITDGQYTVGYFWTQKSTVGWSRVKDIAITIDLGADTPIRGLMFSTAAGVAGVKWPGSIAALVSSDGRAYHRLGDLVELSAGDTTPPDAYGVHRFATDKFKAHGRFVKLEIAPVGNCCFVDEIEVYRGDAEWIELPLPGEAVNYPPDYFEESVFDAAWKRRIGMDLEAVRTAVDVATIEPGLRRRLKADLAEIDAATRALPSLDPATFRGVFPFNEVHARVYAVLGVLRGAQGHAPVVAWRADPWAYIAPMVTPSSAAPEIRIAAMKGEMRAGAVNLTNCSGAALNLRLAFTGLPGAPTPGCLIVHQVEWTDTREGLAVAAALSEIVMTEGSYTISLPAGMTRQVWLSFRPRDLKPGMHRGRLRITGGEAVSLDVPVALRVFDVDFPTAPRLHVGGWDYTNSTLYGVTAANKDALVAHLQDRYVDSPWATSDILGYGEFDAAGQFTKRPPTVRLDAWVERWATARNYHVFKRVGDSIGGTKIGEPLFAKKVASWITFWVAHARTLGIEPSRLFLLLVDEPRGRAEDETIIAWARAIKAAEPEVVIFDDGTRPVERILPDIMDAIDVICPHRPTLLDPESDRPVSSVIGQVKAGARLYLYSCKGPARLLDPYAYHRLQAWSCFQLGGEGSFFWAFGASGGGSSWNEYASSQTAFTPLFLGPDSATPGKHMEAIRQSVGDFEYLAMLRDRVVGLGATQPDHRLLQTARTLLATAVDRVLSAPGVTGLKWEDEKDTTIADAVCWEIGELLERLK